MLTPWQVPTALSLAAKLSGDKTAPEACVGCVGYQWKMDPLKFEDVFPIKKWGYFIISLPEG